MSFSKAKIQRFNDVKTAVPGTTRPPGSEKTKVKTKVENANRCDQPLDKAKSDTASSQSVPCFRTPQLLRKKPKLTSNQTSKPKSTEIFNNEQNLEALKEKIVECENKDAYIKDLTQQLEDFKLKINKIENEARGINTEEDRFEQTIENLKNEHENKIKIIQEEFRLRLSDTISIKDKIANQLLQLKSSVLSYNTEMQELKSNITHLPHYFEKYIEKYKITINQKQADINEKENLLKILEQNTIEMQNQHSLETEKLREEQQIEMQDLEFEMLKTMTELQREKEVCANKIKETEEEMMKKVSELRNIFESDKKKIVFESESKLKQMEEIMQKSHFITEKEIEQKITKLENEWKNKLMDQQRQSDDILKECQAISEYNIIQCEIEKNNITQELKENVEELKRFKLNYNDTLENFNQLKNTYKELKKELNLKKEELDIIKKELQNEILDYKNRLNQALKEKVAYEFTLKNSQVTIDVLKRRLIHSDKDVEQLKEELAECEKKLLEYEQKNLQLTSDLVQAQLFNDELEMQFESTIKLNCTDIDNMSENLLKEVNDYKKEVIKYKNQIKGEQNLKKEIIQQLHDAYDMVNKLKIEFEHAENDCSQFKFEVEQSQNELEDYHMREMDWNIIKDKLEYTIKELEDLLEAKVLEVNDMKKEMIHLKENRNCDCESSEYYQQKVRELEDDQKETGNIHKKYIEMSGKYDVLVWKYEELEAENLQNRMKLMKLSDDQADKQALKDKYDNQVILCNELENNNEDLKEQVEQRLKEESSFKEDFTKMKAERDALLNKCQQLENQLKQHNLENENKPRTPKKSKKFIDEENYSDTKKWMKKTKHPKDDKENMSSPNRTLNSPLRERN